MKSKIIIFVFILSLLPLFVFADDNKLEGSITLTGKINNISGNVAKFNEYRDIRDGFGAYSGIRLNYDKEKYFLNLKTDDIGYDTQNYRLDGGMWGKFKGYLNYYEIPHNFTFDAKSFYSGIGGNNLTYSTNPPSTNISTWNEFDYSIERKNYGGGFRLDLLKPFFFDFSVSREEKEGIKPTSSYSLVELPEPVDYKTDVFKLEAGYAKNPLFLSMSFYYSEFENDNNILNFRNPTATLQPNTDSITLPPDNSYYKLDFKSAVKLPLSSKFQMNLASSRKKSDATLMSSYVSGATLYTVTSTDPKFDGKIDTQNYAFVLSSNPISFLDGKVFYKHYKTDNESDEITQTRSGSTSIYTNSLFDYKKDTYGVELGFRLPAKLYLNTGYNYLKTKREREDIPENKDDLFSVDLRWSGLDFMVAKGGYERLHRKEKFEGPASPTTTSIIETWARRFDVAAKDRDIYKASVDISPIENLNFGLGYKYKNTDYKNTVLGLRDEKSNEFDIDGDYTIGQFIKLFGYVAYEKIKTYQFQRQFTAGNADPGASPTSTNFNWDLTQNEKEYDYGIGTEIYVIPKKLTFILQHDYVRSNGFADFTYLLGANPLPAGTTQDNIDNSNWDDYRLKSYMVKAKYNATKNFVFSVGYAYEKFRYSDAQYDGYNFLPSTTYLTGAYKDQSYSSSVVFLGASYKF